MISYKQRNPKILRNLIAEVPSSYSDLSVRTLQVKFNSAKEALSVLYILRHSWAPWETEEIIRKISQKCYNSKYSGEWATVQEFLEQKHQTPESFELLYITKKGPHDFYGNFLWNTVKILSKFRVRETLSVTTDTRPVKRPQRKRGYNDKGTLRQNHEFHGDPPVREADPTRPDYRNKVNHPLLAEEIIFCDSPDRRTHPSQVQERKEEIE